MDVVKRFPEVSNLSHETIIEPRLPKRARPPAPPIDAQRRKALDGVQNAADCLLGRRQDQSVPMIRHDHICQQSKLEPLVGFPESNQEEAEFCRREGFQVSRDVAGDEEDLASCL